MSRTLLLVSIPNQELRVWTEGTLRGSFVVSTAANGVGCAEGSGCTPTGWHRIAAIHGDGQPTGTRFVSREPVGLWQGEPVEEDWVLTRIFRLEGIEDGVNRGPGIDSFDRYIYLHGTNREDLLGTPASHGCIRLANADCLRLEAMVQVGDLVHLG